MKRKFEDGTVLSKETVFCSCGNDEHQLIFSYFSDDKTEIYCDVYLANYMNFFKRLKYGMMYILGYKSKYGAFDSIIIDESNLDVFQNIIKHLKIRNNNR